MSWVYAICVFLVFSLALSLRLAGIPFGEPFSVHPDEPLFVKKALTILSTGDLNPHWFGHPGSFTIYNLSALYALKAWLGGVPLEQLIKDYGQDLAPFHALGKHLIIFWSLLGHLGLWLLASQFMPKWPSLLAVLLMASAAIDVDIATLIRTDTQQSTLLVFLCFCLVRGMKSGRGLWFMGAGLLLGMATAVKWPSVAACLSIVLAVSLCSKLGAAWPPSRRQIQFTFAAALASGLGLFLCAPYVYLDFSTVLANVAAEATVYHLSATSPGFFSALLFYSDILQKSVNWLGIGLSLLGVVFALRSEQRRQALIPLSLFVLYLFFIAAQHLRWNRWTVPLVPYVCLFAAMGVAGLLDWAARRHGPGFRVRAIRALVGMALALGVAKSSVEIAQARAYPSRGVLASRWIMANLPEGSAILTEYSAPAVPQGRFKIYSLNRRTGKLARVEDKSRYVLASGPIGELRHLDSALEQVDYVIVGPYHKRLRAESKRYAHPIAIYDRLFKKTKTMKKFGDIQIRAVKKRRASED